MPLPEDVDFDDVWLCGCWVVGLAESVLSLPPWVWPDLGSVVLRTASWVYDGVVAARFPGVGSNRTQPEPWKYSSGQACRSCAL